MPPGRKPKNSPPPIMAKPKSNTGMPPKKFEAIIRSKPNPTRKRIAAFKRKSPYLLYLEL
jgi:hypothetical protein